MGNALSYVIRQTYLVCEILFGLSKSRSIWRMSTLSPPPDGPQDNPTKKESKTFFSCANLLTQSCNNANCDFKFSF